MQKPRKLPALTNAIQPQFENCLPLCSGYRCKSYSLSSGLFPTGRCLHPNGTSSALTGKVCTPAVLHYIFEYQIEQTPEGSRSVCRECGLEWQSKFYSHPEYEGYSALDKLADKEQCPRCTHNNQWQHKKRSKKSK